jgi:hypothetical protein
MLARLLSYIPFFAKLFTLPARARIHSHKENPVLYAFCCGPARQSKRGQRYKVGKTINLDRRVRPYRTIYPQGKVYHTVRSADIDVTERWLHDALKLSGYHVEREIFEIPPPLLMNTMDAIVNLHAYLAKHGKSSQKMHQLAHILAADM